MRKFLTVFLFVLIVAMVAIPAVCVAEDSSVSEGDVYRVSPSVEIILPAPMPAPEPMPEPEPTEDQDDSIYEGDVYRVSRDVEISLPSPMPAPEPMPEPEPEVQIGSNNDDVIVGMPPPETPKMWSNQELTVFCELNNGTITVWTDGIESPRLFVFDITSCHVEVLEPSGDGGVYPTFRLEKPRGRMLFLAVFDGNGTVFKITI